MTEKREPSYQELKRCLATESAIQTLRVGQVDTVLEEREALAVCLAKAVAREAHIKNVLLAVRNVNQLIVAESDPKRLIERACINLTETLGYHNAWIALVDETAAAATITVFSGPSDGFEIMQGRLKRGEFTACVKRALVQDEIVVTTEPSAECRDCPLLQEYSGQAGLTRRLAYEGKTYGILSAFVPAAYAHDPEEQELFNELADDLAFALRKIEDAEALRQSEELYRTLVESTPDAIILLDPDRNIVSCNQGFCSLFGHSLKEVKGKSIRIIHQSEEAFHKFGREAYESVTRTGSYRGELDFRKKDGTLVPAETVTSPIGKNGSVAGYVGIIRDITERKSAEEALRQSEARIRFLAENVADIIWTTDKNFRTTYVSPSIEKVLGFTPEERKNQALEEAVTPESLKKIWKLFADELERDKTVKADPGRSLTVEVEYYRKDGGTVWLENKVKWMRDAEGTVVGLHGVARDISERKWAEEEREKLQAQLTQAQKMESVGRLAGGVAHDFNNMLGVILGRAEMSLMGMKPGDPHHENLEEIRKAAGRSADLTRQLLAFARKQTIAPKMLDLNDTVEGILKMLRRLIGEDIDLAWQPHTNLWPVKMDPAQVDQILANLCVNARDAISGTGKITIVTRNIVLSETYCAGHPGFVPGQYVMLSLSDDGCGMDEETQSHLFEPFFTTKEVGKGTGLGLATVYGIVKQNNGFVDVHSEPGKGTSFRIYLPRHAAGEKQIQKEGVPSPATHGQETVLLVEDEPAILKIATMMLERQGYRVLSASKPDEAISVAKEHAGEIHLLMTDVVMPEMNGRDLAKNLTSFCPGLKRLFMSGYSADVIAHQGMLEEGVHFIQKPFSLQDLAAKVREALS